MQKIDQRFISEDMTNDGELALEAQTRASSDSNLQSQINTKVDKITPITGGVYRRPVFTVNSQGQITSIREKLLMYTDSNIDATNNTTSWVQFLNINFTALEQADYFLEFMTLYSHSSTNSSPLIDILLDGVGIYSPDFSSHEEVSDSTSSERVLRSGFDVKNITAGSHTLELVFRAESNGSTMTMRYGSLRLSEE